MVAKERLTIKLSDKEKKAIREFIRMSRLSYGDKIRRAALFGSKARGDWKKYSDIDVLLITTDDSWGFRKSIWSIAAGVELKYDVLIDVRVISASRWQYMENIQAGLYQNITRDAVPIRFRKIAPTGA